MSWQTSLTIIVRTLINDLNPSDYRYSDERIEQSIVVAALIVNQEYPTNTNYNFDLSTPNILPDPLNDSAFTALIGLKAACILAMNDYQNSVLNNGLGIKVVEGDSQVDLSGGFTGYKDIVNNGVCKSYEKLLKKLQISKSMMSGKAIASPYTHHDFLFTYGFPVSDFYNQFAY